MISIRGLDESDWPAVLSIYRQGLATGRATFETDAPAGRNGMHRTVADGCRGRGIGMRLLQALDKAAEAAGFWTLQGGIFATTASSIRLPLSCGFRLVGTRERIGSLTGTGHDVVLVERRSQKP
jgi:L-amino acid N-acyltransferase YncA